MEKKKKNAITSKKAKNGKKTVNHYTGPATISAGRIIFGSSFGQSGPDAPSDTAAFGPRADDKDNGWKAYIDAIKTTPDPDNGGYLFADLGGITSWVLNGGYIAPTGGLTGDCDGGGAVARVCRDASNNNTCFCRPKDGAKPNACTAQACPKGTDGECSDDPNGQCYKLDAACNRNCGSITIGPEEGCSNAAQKFCGGDGNSYWTQICECNGQSDCYPHGVCGKVTPGQQLNVVCDGNTGCCPSAQGGGKCSDGTCPA